MPDTAEPLVLPEMEQETRTRDTHAPSYLVICWNDPVNLMHYVTHVFQTVFGWERARAEKCAMEIHKLGKGVLVRESLEKAEFHLSRLQAYSLKATLERES